VKIKRGGKSSLPKSTVKRLGLTISEVGKLSEGNKMIQDKISSCIIDLLVTLPKFKPMPTNYIPLLETLHRYFSTEFAIQYQETMQSYKDFIRSSISAKAISKAKILREKAEIIEKKSLNTKEAYYNRLFDILPYNGIDNSYHDVHQYLFKEKGFSHPTLRKYKERRIKKMKDYRETRLNPAEEDKVITTIKNHDYRLQQNTLQELTGFDEPTLLTVLNSLEKQKRITYAKQNIDGNIIDVIVVTK
jgi:hypothetical protein